VCVCVCESPGPSFVVSYTDSITVREPGMVMIDLVPSRSTLFPLFGGEEPNDTADVMSRYEPVVLSPFEVTIC